MFESIKSFFTSTVPSFFHSAYDTVSQGVHKVVDGAKYLIGLPPSIVTTIYTDTKSVVKGVGDTVTHIIDKSSDTVKSVIDGAKGVITNGQNVIGGTVSNVGQSLSMPLVLLGAGGLIYMLNQKK